MSYFTSIPVGLCEYALVNRKINQLKLYLFLKLNSSGYVKYDDDIYEHINSWAKRLSISPKTVLSSYKWLIKNKWITINGISKSIHIISYKHLYRKLRITIKTSIIYEPDDFADLKGLCCAAVFIYYRNQLRYFNKQSGAKMTLSNTNCKIPKDFYPVSLSYIASRINVSKSTANNYKSIAKSYGFIESKRNLIYLVDSKGAPITIEGYYILKKNLGDFGDRLRRGKKYLKVVDADLIKSNIWMKKCRY